MEVTIAALAVSIIVALGTTPSFADEEVNWKQKFSKCETSVAVDVKAQLAQCNEKGIVCWDAMENVNLVRSKDTIVRCNGKEIVKECPLGFTKNEKLGSCYNFVTRQKMIWIHALAYCTAQGANLAAIETQEELTFIQQEIVRKGLPSPGSESDSFYTGGTSINGAWQWLGGTSGPTKPMEFAPWESGQGATDGQLCHTLWAPWKYLWGDIHCTSTYATNFICEIELN